MMDVPVSTLKDFVSLGLVLGTCVWSVAKIRGTIETVKMAAESTAKLLGKDIQHLTLAIAEFKQEIINLKKDALDLDRRLQRLEIEKGVEQ